MRLYVCWVMSAALELTVTNKLQKRTEQVRIKIKGLKMNQQQNQDQYSKGFTLIELLVVVAILAAMAGIAVSAVGTYEQKARADLAQTEIKRIANAVMKFKEDTGYFPKTGVFASEEVTQADKSDFGFLFYSPSQDGVDESSKGAEILPWDIAASRGWNGPYLSMDSADYMRNEGCHLKEHEGGLKVFPSNANRQQDANGLIGLADPFEALMKYSESTELCFVTTQEYRKGNGTQQIAKPFSGQPYQYETAFKNNRYPDCSEQGSGCVALLSAGENGVFENGDKDDLVRILKVN